MFLYLGGTIDVSVQPDHRRYKFGFGGGEQLWVAEWNRDEQRFADSRPISEDDAVKLLAEKHWSWNDFVCVWQGWASGYERGKADGREEAFEQVRAKDIVLACNAHDDLVETLRGVALMLRTELKQYDKEPWAKRVISAVKEGGAA